MEVRFSNLIVEGDEISGKVFFRKDMIGVKKGDDHIWVASSYYGVAYSRNGSPKSYDIGKIKICVNGIPEEKENIETPDIVSHCLRLAKEERQRQIKRHQRVYCDDFIFVDDRQSVLSMNNLYCARHV